MRHKYMSSSSDPPAPNSQRQIIINLHSSGIEPDIIALQLDIDR